MTFIPPTLKRWALLSSHITGWKWPIKISWKRETANSAAHAGWFSVDQSDHGLTEWTANWNATGGTEQLGRGDALLLTDDNKTGHLADAFFRSDKYKCCGDLQDLRLYKRPIAKNAKQLQQSMKRYNSRSEREAAPPPFPEYQQQSRKRHPPACTPNTAVLLVQSQWFFSSQQV